jgi:hypothetical protein
MDVSRAKNTVTMKGNLAVDQDLVVSGNLTVNGKTIGADNNKPVNQLCIGDPNVDGCWKLELDEGELMFSQKVEGEWVVKQSMS